MPEVSVLLSSFRPAGVDISLSGLAHQSFTDFEVIFVDRRYERRHDRVMAMARDYGVNLIHVPEHRRNGQWAGIASAWNTAAAVARGRIIVFLQDWAFALHDWVESHAVMHSGPIPRYLLQPYIYTHLPPLHRKKWVDLSLQEARRTNCVDEDAVLRGEVFDEIFAFTEAPLSAQTLIGLPRCQPPKGPYDPRVRTDGPGVPETWVHIKNESMLRETFYELKGLDEWLDRGKGPIDTDFGIRMAEHGVELYWMNGPAMICPNGRFVCASMPWGKMDERVAGRWSWDDGVAYNTRRRAEAIEGDIRAKNPYDIRVLAAELEGWRSDVVIDVAPLDMPDATYWESVGGPPWPDTP